MIDSLVRASLEGGVMVGGIWILSRALPRLSPAVKATLWWCAAAKFIITVVWATPVVLPILPAAAIEHPAALLAGAPPAESSVSAGIVNPAYSPPPIATPIDWTFVALVLWGAGVALSAAIGVHQWRRIRQTIARSTIADPGVEAMADGIAQLLALARAPDVRMSSEIDSPLITGLRRPVVLLPATRFSRLDADQQRMAICHELVHMKRGDIWFGCVPAAAERIFFFHPLVRLASREYIFWREAACDAAVLRALDAAPQAYGRLLLDLGVTRPQPALAAAGAAWSFSNLKRRIVMLQQPSTPRRGTGILAGAIIAVTVVAIAPLRLGAREAVLPPSAPVLPWSSSLDMPMPVIEQPAERSPAVEPVQEPRSEPRQREELRFVFLSEENTTMSGNRRDVERARNLRKGGESLLWFVRDGKQYVVRDPEVLEQLKNHWEPVSRIGAEQGVIGAKQGEIGAQQGRIGARQGRIGAEQGAAGARHAEIAARAVELSVRETRQLSAQERREIELARDEVEKTMKELDREMAALGDRMRAADEPMSKLGAEMEVLGVQMSALGKQMEEASRQAEARMRTLIERAVAGGTAQQVK